MNEPAILETTEPRCPNCESMEIEPTGLSTQPHGGPWKRTYLCHRCRQRFILVRAVDRPAG